MTIWIYIGGASLFLVAWSTLFYNILNLSTETQHAQRRIRKLAILLKECLDEKHKIQRNRIDWESDDLKEIINN